MVKMARTYARNVILTVIAVIVGWALPPHHIPFFAAAAVLALLYARSLRRRPTRTCWTCGGSGGFRGTLFRYAQGLCPSCGGQKGHRRWGVTIFYPNQQVRNEVQAATAKRRRAAPR
jgi:hypothetical protein